VGCRASDPDRRLIPGSEAQPCSVCGLATMFSPESLKSAKGYGIAIRFVCLECSRLDNHVIARPTEGQKSELSAAGHDPEDWPLRDFWGKLVKSPGPE